MAMRKTSVYLSEADRRKLAALARKAGLSQAEVIRDAIASYELDDGEPEPLALIGTGYGPGTSVADIPEEELLKGFGE